MERCFGSGALSGLMLDLGIFQIIFSYFEPLWGALTLYPNPFPNTAGQS